MWWEILELTAEADQKAIKQAYARKLKQTRPDENPEGFQALHQAYKQALDWQANKDWYVEDENEDEDQWAEDEPATATLKASTLTISKLEPPEKIHLPTEEQADELSFEADWQDFQQQLAINFHSETARKDPQEWIFIEQLPSFMDLEFRERLSHELFGFISESNLKAAEQRTIFIKPTVLQYLNQLFAWDQQWRYFTTQFGEPQTDAILRHLEPYQTTKTTAKVQPEALHYYARFMAFMIDLALVFTLTLAINLVLEQVRGGTHSESTLPVGILIWLIVYPLIEASSWQASFGKRLMKLRVVNKQGHTLSLAHAYIRHLITSACILGFKVVVWINLLLVYKRTMLLQDWLSQSYVVKRT